MPDITQDVKHLVKGYDPEKQVYSILDLNRAADRCRRGWKEEGEILQRDGTVLKVVSRPKVWDDQPVTAAAEPVTTVAEPAREAANPGVFQWFLGKRNG